MKVFGVPEKHHHTLHMTFSICRPDFYWETGLAGFVEKTTIRACIFHPGGALASSEAQYLFVFFFSTVVLWVEPFIFDIP